MTREPRVACWRSRAGADPARFPRCNRAWPRPATNARAERTAPRPRPPRRLLPAVPVVVVRRHDPRARPDDDQPRGRVAGARPPGAHDLLNEAAGGVAPS